MITENKPTQDPINLSLKELIAADLPAPLQTEAKEDGFIALPSSSCQAYKYDEATETLYIRFKNGVYEYFDVPEKVVEMMLEAKSIGSFFYYNIRAIYNYALSKKYKVKGTKRTVKESQDAMEQNDGFNWSEEHRAHLENELDKIKSNPTLLQEALAMLDEEFGVELDFDEASEGIVNIDTWNKVFPGIEEDCEELFDRLRLITDKLQESVEVESEIEPDVTDEQETFYFTSSSKDILGIKGLEHPRAQGLAVEILAKFREEFQSALDAADISQYFIMTLEFKDKEQMPNAELQEEELNDDNPLN